ncbi:MAG: hypothetical protein Hals2KO_07690 [Halioglobus sp.]
MKRNHKFVAATVLALATVLLVAGLDLPVKTIVSELVARGKSYGNWATLPYLVLYVAAAVSGLSRTLLNVLAGVVFAPAVAVLAVFVASSAAFAATFCIARFIARDAVEKYLERIPSARTLMTAVDNYGFRLLVLMRMNPLIPGFINGYGFGLTSIRPGAYMIASIIGSMPLSLLHIYLGWAGGEMLLADGQLPGDVQHSLLIAGCVLSFLLLLAISWYAQSTMRSPRYAVQANDDQEAPQSDPVH